MNERILELAKQAGLKFPSEEALSPVEIKFAELIIEECCDYVRAIDAMEIKKHFGVEE